MCPTCTYAKAQSLTCSPRHSTRRSYPQQLQPDFEAVSLPMHVSGSKVVVLRLALAVWEALMFML